ncbi:MAG: transglutaminaseTgpA domain-containing protein [Armatimonadota bacterium]
MRRTTGPDISYPLYLAGLATMLCALTALNSVVSDNSFAILTGTLMCIGYITSLILRRVGYTTRLIEFVVIIAAILVYLQVIGGRAINELIIPINAAGSSEMKLASMLLWLEVLRSFTLVSDEAVVFSSIPAVVLISLTATNNINSEIMAAFIIYLVLATFTLAHQPVRNKQSIKPGFRMAIAVTCLSIVMGYIAVIPVRLACKKAFSIAMPQFTQLRDRTLMASVDDSSTLQISQGPVHLTDKVVMSIKSHSLKTGETYGTYWRSNIFDRYTGHGWKSTAQYMPISIEQVSGRYGNGWNHYNSIPPEHGELIEQIIYPRILIEGDVIAATEPVTIEGPFSGLKRNDFNCYYSYSAIGNLPSYRVVSSMPITDQSRLRKASTDYSESIRSFFLQTTTSTVKAGRLAMHITRGIDNPYDKAVAINRYLGEHCTYDLNAPPAPAGQDPVDYFLFKSRTGYCDVFASAMVVMMRETGVPARLVTGYATGDYDTDAGVFKIRDMDRHAWAEVYFPDCGWVTFDPTELTREHSESLFGRIFASFSRLFRNILSGSIILPLMSVLLIIGAGIIFVSDIRKLRPFERHSSPSKLHSIFVARYESILRSLKVKNKDLTPCEAAIAGTKRSHDASAIALETANLFGSMRYSGRDITVGDIKELERLHRELKAALKRASGQANEL